MHINKIVSYYFFHQDYRTTFDLKFKKHITRYFHQSNFLLRFVIMFTFEYHRCISFSLKNEKAGYKFELINEPINFPFNKLQTYAQGMEAELLHVRNNCVTEVEIIHENPRGLLSGDYGVPVNLIENPRCESRIRVSSHAWPKLSSLDDWQSGRKRYALVQVYRIPSYRYVAEYRFSLYCATRRDARNRTYSRKVCNFYSFLPLIKRIH